MPSNTWDWFPGGNTNIFSDPIAPNITTTCSICFQPWARCPSTTLGQHGCGVVDAMLAGLPINFFDHPTMMQSEDGICGVNIPLQASSMALCGPRLAAPPSGQHFEPSTRADPTNKMLATPCVPHGRPWSLPILNGPTTSGSSRLWLENNASPPVHQLPLQSAIFSTEVEDGGLQFLGQPGLDRSSVPSTIDSTVVEGDRSRHEGDGILWCHACKASFTEKRSLDRHTIEVHKGRRPFKCPHVKCEFFGKGFKREGDLARHLKRKH